MIQVKAKTKRSPAREALAGALERHRQAVDGLAALKTSRERAVAAVRGAEAAVAEKRAVHERAKEEHVERIANGTAVGVNVSTSPASKVREARSALMDAEDDLTAAREALAHFDRKLSGEADKAPEPEPEDEEDGTYRVRQQPWNLQAIDVRPAYRAAHHLPPHDPLKATADAIAAAVRAVVLEHGTAVAMKAFEDADAAYSEAVRKGAMAAEIARRNGLSPEMIDFLYQHGRRSNNVPMAVVYNGNNNSKRVETYWPDDGNHRPLPETVAVQTAWADAVAALDTNADAELPAP